MGRVADVGDPAHTAFMDISLLQPAGLVVSPAFSHVAVVPPGATTIYVGGQNAVDRPGALVGGTAAAAQTRQVLATLVPALEAAGRRGVRAEAAV